MHEIPELDSKGLRQFGLMAAGFFIGVFGLLFPWLADADLPKWPWILGVILALWALIAPATMRGLYTVWMKVAMFIGSIINRVVLTIAFYGLFFPLGLALRLLGKKPLHLDLDKNSTSYREISTLDKREKMEKPF
jgi:hypothetical protein